MKAKISSLFVGLSLSATAVMMTGCIEETFPTSVATQDQLESSDKATEALLWAMPGIANKVGTISSGYHYDWGYGSIMHVRDVMTGDLPVVASGYNWYTNWELNQYQGESYVYSQFLWNFYWKAVQTANNMIAGVNAATASDVQMGMQAAGYAYRAMYYLDMARMWEFLPNDKTSAVNASGNNVEGLTVPIVKEGMTEEEARENPRATRAEMAAFILADLDSAEKHINKLAVSDNTLPHLAAVYGLKARYYMWLEDYASAKDYARRAIGEASVDPMSEEECLSTTKGFNTISCWIWGVQLVEEDDCVKTGILNWASWMSNETLFGYSGTEPYIMIDASMYDRISDTDFRKKMWKAPEGGNLEGQTPFLDNSFAEGLCEYASVKFRPAEGNFEQSSVGTVTAYPLMRVEEMCLIEAEAAAHLNDGDGQALITAYMASYRDPNYTCTLTGDALVEEIVFQKRVELWGEGQSFFDIKRLNLSVNRGYAGSNFQEEARFNTNGRPAWMNICIVQTEKNNNSALVGFENPDPSGLYEPVVIEE